jgi:hypothetical protein
MISRLIIGVPNQFRLHVFGMLSLSVVFSIIILIHKLLLTEVFIYLVEYQLYKNHTYQLIISFIVFKRYIIKYMFIVLKHRLIDSHLS